MNSTIVIGLALVVAQALVVRELLAFVHTFGAYTAAHGDFTKMLLKAHESNLDVHRANVQVLEELKQQTAAREAA